MLFEHSSQHFQNQFIMETTRHQYSFTALGFNKTFFRVAGEAFRTSFSVDNDECMTLSLAASACDPNLTKRLDFSITLLEAPAVPFDNIFATESEFIFSHNGIEKARTLKKTFLFSRQNRTCSFNVEFKQPIRFGDDWTFVWNLKVPSINVPLPKVKANVMKFDKVKFSDKINIKLMGISSMSGPIFGNEYCTPTIWIEHSDENVEIRMANLKQPNAFSHIQWTLSLISEDDETATITRSGENNTSDQSYVLFSIHDLPSKSEIFSPQYIKRGFFTVSFDITLTLK